MVPRDVGGYGAMGLLASRPGARAGLGNSEVSSVALRAGLGRRRSSSSKPKAESSGRLPNALADLEPIHTHTYTQTVPNPNPAEHHVPHPPQAPDGRVSAPAHTCWPLLCLNTVLFLLRSTAHPYPPTHTTTTAPACRWPPRAVPPPRRPGSATRR